MKYWGFNLEISPCLHVWSQLATHMKAYLLVFVLKIEFITDASSKNSYLNIGEWSTWIFPMSERRECTNLYKNREKPSPLQISSQIWLSDACMRKSKLKLK